MSCCGTACSHDQPCVGFNCWLAGSEVFPSISLVLILTPLMEPEPDADEEPEEEGQESFKVAQVYMVSRIMSGQSVRQWLPDTQIVSGMLFGCCCKWDSSFIRLVTGKGLTLHKKREANNLNVKLWSEICSERARCTSQLTSYSCLFILFFWECNGIAGSSN